MSGDGGVEVGEFGVVTADAGESFDVLGGFLAQDFEGIIVGDDSEEVVEFIDDGEDDEVVFGEGEGGFFLVGGGEDEFIGIFHDVADGGVPGIESEIAEADFSDEAALDIDDEDAGKGFGVFAVAAEDGECLFDRHVSGDAADVCGHASAGGVFLVFQEIFGEFLVSGAEEGEEADLSFFGDDLEDVDAVVIGEVAEEEAELCGFEVAEGVFDEGIREFSDDIGGEFRPDGFKEDVAFFVVEVFVECGEVGVVDVFRGGEKSGAVLGEDGAFDLVDRGYDDVIGHGGEGGEGGGSGKVLKSESLKV